VGPEGPLKYKEGRKERKKKRKEKDGKNFKTK
jgi:hypothetical protein